MVLKVHMKMSHCSIPGESYFVTLSDNGPVVLGANITFKAELFTSYGTSPSGTFRFRWRDNAIPPHFSEVSCNSFSYFNIVYIESTRYGTKSDCRYRNLPRNMDLIIMIIYQVELVFFIFGLVTGSRT